MPSAIDSNYGTSLSMFDAGKRKKITTSLSSPSKALKVLVTAPRSLSVSTILQLGKVVKSNTTLVQLYSYNIDSLTWSNVPAPVEFEISEDVLGKGGFRKAYKATTTTKGYAEKTWVVKRYKQEALAIIGEIGQTVEDQVKKVWKLSRHIAAQWVKPCEPFQTNIYQPLR